MKVLILCGGLGTRAYPFTRTLPKALLPVGGIPVVEQVMRIYAAQGYDRFVLAAGHMKDAIDSYFRTRRQWNVRCVDTVKPLAAKLGLDVEPIETLAEGHAVNAAIELLAALPDNSVVCSHGDLIPAVIDALEWRGMHVEGDPDWRKGSTWILERDGDEFVRAKAVAPPA